MYIRYYFVLLNILLCVTLWFISFLPQRCTKVITKVHKGFLQQFLFKTKIIIFQEQKYIVNEKHNYFIINNNDGNNRFLYK